MELFGQICWWIAAGLTVLAAPVALWHLLRGLRGLFPMLARPVREERRLRFAVVVCARNEQAVIGSLIDSLMAQRYPRDCFSVFVVADNCTDGTAAEAARHGALVYEREDAQRVGKGCALSWAFDKLREDYGDRFDAAAVFDADNLVDPGFLAAVNDVLCTGADVTQGYRDSTNPDESAVSSCYAVYWLLLMRFFHRARYNSGLPCLVGGTGFAFRWSCIAQNGWHTQTLGEDSEFSLRQILAGRQIVPAYRAVFYDEQPTTWAVSFRQRFRWLVGSVQCMRYLPACLKSLFHRQKGDGPRLAAAVDMTAYLLAAPACTLLVVSGLFGLLAMAFTPAALGARIVWCLASFAGGWVFMTLLALLTVLLEHKPLKIYGRGILLFPVFLIPMGWMAVAALLHPRTDWKPIVHTGRRNAAAPEMEKA